MLLGLYTCYLDTRRTCTRERSKCSFFCALHSAKVTTSKYPNSAQAALMRKAEAEKMALKALLGGLGGRANQNCFRKGDQPRISSDVCIEC